MKKPISFRKSCSENRKYRANITQFNSTTNLLSDPGLDREGWNVLLKKETGEL